MDQDIQKKREIKRMEDKEFIIKKFKEIDKKIENLDKDITLLYITDIITIGMLLILFILHYLAKI
jgi:hypothetical protein